MGIFKSFKSGRVSIDPLGRPVVRKIRWRPRRTLCSPVFLQLVEPVFGSPKFAPPRVLKTFAPFQTFFPPTTDHLIIHLSRIDLIFFFFLPPLFLRLHRYPSQLKDDYGVPRSRGSRSRYRSLHAFQSSLGWSNLFISELFFTVSFDAPLLDFFLPPRDVFGT